MLSVLETRGLGFSYAKDKPLFRDLDLQVFSEERVCLQAPSGFGKSTLCQLLAGYLKPAAGEVLLDGEPLRVKAGNANPVQLIWQHPEQALDPYLRLGRSLDEAGEVPCELLDALGIEGAWLERFPHELSGGQLQRCCIARTLALRPRFIIADEISTMLDAVTQAQIWDFLLSYCREHGVGLVFVTHSRALQDRLATRVVDLTA